jgi:serine/threonine protein kinase
MAPRAFDDGELTINVSSTHVRRTATNNGKNDTVPVGASAESKAPLKEKIKTEQRIGAYKVIRTLGEGSFGKVKLAIHQSTGQQVALKIIARKKLISRDMAGRVEREIEYLQLLRHPHIIKLYDCLLLNPTQLKSSIPFSSPLPLPSSDISAAIPSSRPQQRSSWFWNMPEANYSTTSSNTVG